MEKAYKYLQKRVIKILVLKMTAWSLKSPTHIIKSALKEKVYQYPKKHTHTHSHSQHPAIYSHDQYLDFFARFIKNSFKP